MLLVGAILFTATLFAQPKRTTVNPCLPGEVLMMDATTTDSHETIAVNARQTTWWDRNCKIRHSTDVDSLMKQTITRVFVCKDTTTPSDLTPKGLPLLPMQCCTTIVNCPPPTAPPTTCCPADSAWRISRLAVFGEGTTLAFNGAPPTGKLKPSLGIEINLTGYRAKTLDSTKPMTKSPWEPRVGLQLSIGKTDPANEVSCDTCWQWGPIDKKWGLRGTLFAEIRWVGPTGFLGQPKNQIFYRIGPRVTAFEKVKGETIIPGLDGLRLEGGVGITLFRKLNLELNTFYTANRRFGFGVYGCFDIFTRPKEKQEPKGVLTYVDPRHFD